MSVVIARETTNIVPFPQGTMRCARPLRICLLERGQPVFQAGEPKAFVFRIECGTVEIVWPADCGAAERREVLGEDDVFGLGFLDDYICDAVALEGTTVSVWNPADLPFLAVLDQSVHARQGIETECEFFHRRATLTALAPTDPERRLAGFLALISRFNQAGGRDPLLIDEDIGCASVAAYLQIDLDTLGRALVALQRRGLVALAPPRGLRLVDLEKLAGFAERY